jgi:hypothetical protein
MVVNGMETRLQAERKMMSDWQGPPLIRRQWHMLDH